MTIDWSKAPDGATHLTLPNSPNQRPVFWRVSGSKALEAWPMEKDFSVVRDHFRYGADGCPSFIDRLAIPKPEPWTGEGLPPVGTVCEIIPHNTLWGFSVLDTYPSTILAYHSDFAWIDVGVPGVPVSTRIDKVDFRPARTAEQIKAEKEISDMIDDAMDGHMCLTEAEAKIVCTQLHKAGYRKQVAP